MAKKKVSRDALDALDSSTDYTAEAFDNGGGYFIGGLNGSSVFTRKDEAEAVAAALNLAKQWRKVKRAAERLQGELACFDL